MSQPADPEIYKLAALQRYLVITSFLKNDNFAYVAFVYVALQFNSLELSRLCLRVIKPLFDEIKSL